VSKGKRKLSLRDYSRLVLTGEQSAALFDAAVKFDQHSIVSAILGYVLVEHELDKLLRRRFKRNDDKSWEVLLDDRGPLRSFHTKIETAYALGILDDPTRKDLHILRTIRNAFAHSKKLLDFDDDLIVKELLKAKCLRQSDKRYFQKYPKAQKMAGKVCFLVLCMRLSRKLLGKHSRAVSRASREKLKREHPLAYALLKYMDPPPRRGGSRLNLPSPLLTTQNDSPSAQPQFGLLAELFRERPMSDDKADT
jgi:DNA-binding MltR family transcriptional regulator